jgi:hypothetical protein
MYASFILDFGAAILPYRATVPSIANASKLKTLRDLPAERGSRASHDGGADCPTNGSGRLQIVYFGNS